MGKKCIPGVICIENMTLFVLIMILCVLVYMFYNADALNADALNADALNAETNTTNGRIE